MTKTKADIFVDITGLTCPVPLIKARRAIRSASKGQLIEFFGTEKEEISRDEILIALSNLKQPIIENKEFPENRTWHILIKRE